MKKILWLDNDVKQVAAYIDALTNEGYSVDIVSSVTEAEVSLNDNCYNLLILDVMIPYLNRSEEEKYPADKTKNGRELGLWFYDSIKKQLEQSGTQVLVFTIRQDESIYDRFVKAGLPPDQFCTKFALQDVEAFLKKISDLI